MLALTEINACRMRMGRIKKKKRKKKRKKREEKKCLSGNKINEKRNHVFVMPFPKDGFLVPILLYKCMLILPNFMEMSSTAILKTSNKHSFYYSEMQISSLNK